MVINVTVLLTTKETIIPLATIVLAFSSSFSPRYLATSTLTPTPIQMAIAKNSVVMGKIIETALKDLSLIHDTKIQSIRLYEYCIHMEISGGMDIFKIRDFIGSTSILFFVLTPSISPPYNDNLLPPMITKSGQPQPPHIYNFAKTIIRNLRILYLKQVPV